ncbi:MAG: NAD(P)H-dependent glycerol-3-phosphate dehydrogenase [Bacteroidales bacterium]|nr:NAD(P)H-dependent glycerol-3-phosphate dehydrogenase [Bacteroidales bacterium]MBN2814441.1 NAD(P)H-dependent glycerol-3-phosphate dehydrogenase [Bacteroidales bacterium]
MSDQQKVAIIGSGSWATALAKLLLNNLPHLNWYIRSEESIAYFRKYKHNPKYISDIEFDTNNITFFSSINDIIQSSDILVFATPAPFLKDTLAGFSGSFENRQIVSAIKGIIPSENLTVAEFFHNIYQVPFKNISIISGPCHAEEIALERLSYLTIASASLEKSKELAPLFRCHYVKVMSSQDIYGTEYAAVLKNIIAIAAGICHGLGYGDNFQAVLVSNAMLEIKRFLAKTYKDKRKLLSSPYLGDVMVTAYSQFSRNRTFGMMIGKGYSVKTAMLEMNMIAEGYFAVACIHEINMKHGVNMPITDAVYRILYDKISPALEIKLLTEKLK